MLCSRSASLITRTRMSRAMAMTILRMISAWAASRPSKPIRSSLTSPSEILATSGPNCSPISEMVSSSSSTASCSRAASTETASRPRSATTVATPRGWARAGTPEARRLPAWRSRASSKARPTAAVSARGLRWRTRFSSGSTSGWGGSPASSGRVTAPAPFSPGAPEPGWGSRASASPSGTAVGCCCAIVLAPPRSITGRLRRPGRPPRRLGSHGTPAVASLPVLGPAGQGLVEDDVADVGVAPAEGFDRLVLELLVDAEEVLDLAQQVRGDLLDPVDVVPVGVGQGDDQQLLVGALVVGHVEHTDDPGLDLTAREGGLAQQDHGVQGVAVLGQGAGHEAVVGRVVDGAEQHPVEADAARLVVELVLVPRHLGDLHDDVQRQVPAPRALVHRGAGLEPPGPPLS